MKRFKWLLVGSLVLAILVLLAGCVSKSEYETLQAEHTTLIAEKQSLETEKASLIEDKQSLENERDKLATEKATLVKEKESLETKYDELNENYKTLQNEQVALVSEHESLQADYKATNSELAEIKGVYPPRDFSSLRELEDWLLANDVSAKPVTSTAGAWIGRALEVQEDALADGYIVSVDYDGPDEEGGYTVFCTTIIDGYVWYWDPETDEPLQDYYLEKVK